MKFHLLLILLFLYYDYEVFAGPSEDGSITQVIYLDPGSRIDYHPKTNNMGFFNKDLQIYCFRGSRKDLTRFFESIQLHLEIENDEFTQYGGDTPTQVRKHFNEQQSLFNLNFFDNKRTSLKLTTFKQHCIGIVTRQPYRVRLQQFRFDYFRIIEFTVGVCVLVFSGRLSGNSFFFYLTGIALGICSSFMLIIWLTSKLMPRRPMVYTMLIGGWSIGIYFLHRLWDNIQLIFQLYRTYVIWYIVITGLTSFFFCYRIGPPKNKRSKNIIKWILQIIALALIYFSSQYEEASIITSAIIIVLHYFPHSLFYKLVAIYSRVFPPKRRLLTREEFYEEGIKETSKALNELRMFASSPDCKQWKIVSKLSDPVRFAAFVEGDSHLREEEISNFHILKQALELDVTDSSDGEIEKDNSNKVYYDPTFDNGHDDANQWQKRPNTLFDDFNIEESESGTKIYKAIQKTNNTKKQGHEHRLYSDEANQNYQSKNFSLSVKEDKRNKNPRTPQINKSSELYSSSLSCNKRIIQKHNLRHKNINFDEYGSSESDY